MIGRKLLIQNKNKEILKELADEYREIILKEKIKKNLASIGEISAKIILITGVLAGGIVLAVLAPNVIGAIGTVLNKKRKVYFNCSQNNFSRSLSVLKNEKYIKIINQKDGDKIKLTKKGCNKFYSSLIENMTINPSKKWDGYWRVIIFDIPEKLRIARDALRQRLRCLGFYQAQKSVLIFPYPCEKEIGFVRELFNLNRYIIFVKTSYFEGEEALLDHFNLSR